MWHDIRLMRALGTGLFGLAGLALVAIGLMWLSQRPMFHLQLIKIEAHEKNSLQHINALTVRSVALPRLSGNFFTLDLEAARAAFESVPWVRRASVRREWPNQLIVTLEEHVALATWGDKGQLISTKGDVFTANLAEAQLDDDHPLPEFTGPAGSEKEVLAKYQQFNDWFAALDLKAESVQLSARYAWRVGLNNGMSVELGREGANSMQERVQRLIAVYPQLMMRLKGQIESVDLRYPNGLALKSASLDAALDKQEAKKKPRLNGQEGKRKP
ncbi:cell division protein FtsQ/DivIB [Massilia sp. W12]|uniref:cell division protein FtsQ/DivIB n=1 Tax=Massilia sp. W12 TaxID=3126507 RepID=UPI0030D61B8A